MGTLNAGPDQSDADEGHGLPVVEATGLRHEYPDGTLGLAGVDLTLFAGERVAVVGPNGSGKSTLLLALGGLIESCGGSVSYFGNTDDPEVIRDRLGVLVQNPDDYLFNTTVREDIEYGPSQFGVPRERATERIDHLTDRLGLTDLLDQPPFRLSGGEKQRAALACVLSFSPDVLLLDEPTDAVDGRYRERILDLLDSEHRRGRTVVTFTPNLELVPQIADRVVLVGADGTVAETGTTREILTDADLLARHGLQPPATVQLFDGLVDEIPLNSEAARALLEARFE
jgi:cobalt/nickel transport system ATP-binding protein